MSAPLLLAALLATVPVPAQRPLPFLPVDAPPVVGNHCYSRPGANGMPAGLAPPSATGAWYLTQCRT